MNLFNRLFIWQKFTLGFVIVGLFFLSIVFVYHFSMSQVGERYERLLTVDKARSTLGFQLSNTLALMRDVEYTFLTSPTNNLSEEHQDYFEEFLDKLGQLTALEKSSEHGADLKTTNGILKQINVYRNAFIATVQAWKIKGFNENSGLRKQLQEDAKHFEQVVNNFDVENIYVVLLQMSEIHLKFLGTGEEQYVEAFARATESFLLHLNESRMNMEKKQVISEKLDALTKIFQSHALQKPSLRDHAHVESVLKELSDLVKSGRVRNIWRDFYQVRTDENAYLRTHDARYAKQFSAKVEGIQKRLGKKEVGSDILAVVARLKAYRKNFMALVNQDRLMEEREEEMGEATQTIEFLVSYHLGRVTKDMKKASEATRTFSRDRTYLAFGMASVLIVLMIVIAFLLINSLVHPISKVTRAMLHVADGNMDSQVPVTGRDELGQMATIFNQMARQLSVAHDGLQNEQDKLMTILLSAREGIIGTNRDGQVALVNPAALRLLEKTEEEIIEGGFFNLLDDPDYVKQFLATAGFDMPETMVYKGKVLNFFAASIEDKKGAVVGSAALIRDVTEEKKLEGMLRDLSNTDGLTQLLNRRRFDELMLLEYQRARRYGLQLGLLLFDVDHFKKFNDTYGHDQGDRVLQAIANTMKSSFRDVDFCCRYGGEEFCVITPNTAIPGLTVAAERFRGRVEAMVVDNLKVTISIGAVAYPMHLPNAKGPAEIFKAADDALYEAKRSGRNKVCLAKSKEA